MNEIPPREWVRDFLPLLHRERERQKFFNIKISNSWINSNFFFPSWGLISSVTLLNYPKYFSCLHSLPEKEIPSENEKLLYSIHLHREKMWKKEKNERNVNRMNINLLYFECQLSSSLLENENKFLLQSLPLRCSSHSFYTNEQSL